MLALGGLTVLPVSADAVLSGENGRIAFVSGRDADSDALAQIHFLPVPSSSGGGTVSPAVTSVGAQHRHPTWSPDRTKIAYARGNPTGADFDIFVQDLTNPGSTPVNITESPGVTDDRPAWSPDGTKIAYESEVSDGSNQMDVVMQNAPAGGGFVNFTNTTATGQFEGKPAWTPDSSTLFYQKGNAMDAAANVNIVKRPLTGSETLAVSDSGVSEFQPSISPDGSKVCFTLSDNGFTSHADVVVSPITDPPSASTTIVSKDLAVGDYNCTWSPDGTFIAYVNGIFSTGKLVMVKADNSSVIPVDLAQDPGSDNFDGNPDWAPDGRPLCPDSTVTTTRNTPLTFQITCTDTGPAYEQSDVREFSGTSPANGTLTQEFAGDPFTYAPNQGFVGTDSFQVRSFDELGFGSDTGTVTINVRAPGGGGGGGGGGAGGGGGVTVRCAGRTATIVGTSGANVIVGTRHRDVIAALGGSDRIRSRGGNDLVCAGRGRDRVGGGRGKDRLLGGSGPDRLSGDSGNDSLGGDGGRDRLIGGFGRDLLNGGTSRDVCRGGPGRDRGSRCERRSSIP